MKLAPSPAAVSALKKADYNGFRGAEFKIDLIIERG